MDRYFQKFQTISYNGTLVKNLTQRVKVLDAVYNNPFVYYPYDIRPSERPDMLSERYYNDPYSAWIIYHSNKIIDPYHDWYLDQQTFNDFVVKKYGSMQAAMEKILYFRNNWYLRSETISASVYSVLTEGVQKYYEPVPINDVQVSNPTEYKRREIDWKVKTNYVVNYSVANGSGFVHDEIVNVSYDANTAGTGQVLFSNSSIVTLQHIVGNAIGGTVSGSSFLRGSESKANTAMTSVNVVANNIPTAEVTFWSPVTYYDYENEINERNRSIRVLDSAYSAPISRQLKDLLR